MATTPLPPILIHPAFRAGQQTPWGGNRLAQLFNKQSSDPRTGEALEVSALPGLASCDDQGQGLDELIARYGSRLTGSAITGDFPLLLKLLDAREPLSVQVHPGDDYAKQHFQKLGKNEAWLILACEENAHIICGFKEGVSKSQVQEAAQNGPALEALLRKVPVKPGELYYIPAGTVHAIGAGLLLYELQQSSDLTFRLYDWGRTDSKGQARELHLTDSLAVLDVVSRPQPQQASVLSQSEAGTLLSLLSCPFFEIRKIKDAINLKLAPDPRRFAILTALSDTRLDYEGGSLRLSAGQTALLPAHGLPLSITCQEAILGLPSV